MKVNAFFFLRNLLVRTLLCIHIHAPITQVGRYKLEVLLVDVATTFEPLLKLFNTFHVVVNSLSKMTVKIMFSVTSTSIFSLFMCSY